MYATRKALWTPRRFPLVLLMTVAGQQVASGLDRRRTKCNQNYICTRSWITGSGVSFSGTKDK